MDYLTSCILLSYKDSYKLLCQSQHYIIKEHTFVKIQLQLTLMMVVLTVKLTGECKLEPMLLFNLVCPEWICVGHHGAEVFD